MVSADFPKEKSPVSLAGFGVEGRQIAMCYAQIVEPTNCHEDLSNDGQHHGLGRLMGDLSH